MQFVWCVFPEIGNHTYKILERLLKKPKDFQNVIDEYLDDCKKRKVEPEQPYKGTFNVRISPELHRNIAVYAIEHGKTLNTG